MSKCVQNDKRELLQSTHRRENNTEIVLVPSGAKTTKTEKH